MKHISSFHHNDIKAFKFGNALFGSPQMFVHVYFIDGLLIDTAHPKMRKEICKTLTPLPVKQMVITHHHEDHSGNIDAVQKLFGCPVFASSKCVEIMRAPPPISPAQYTLWGKYDPTDILVPHGSKINTEKYSFDIIEVPGHASDMIALHDPNEGILFSADLYVYHRIRYFMRAESMAQQIVSLRKVLKLDFNQMYCSHNPQLDVQPKEQLKWKLNYFEDLYGKVAELHHQGMSPKSIVKHLKLGESWVVRINSFGALSTLNMVRSIIRDEKNN